MAAVTRPHVEFIHARSLPWMDVKLGPGRSMIGFKCLSEEADTGACTALLRYPPGWQSAGPEVFDGEEEFFVLRGSLTLGDRIVGLHDYVYIPAGLPRPELASPDGAIVIAFFSRSPFYRGAEGIAASFNGIVHVASLAMPWDFVGIDPNINHLYAARKNLRLAPDGSSRTYLLAGMPQGVPSNLSCAMEKHPHDEEMFLVEGAMASDRGLMRRGAYFYRPADIWHGLNHSVPGFLALMRTPGSSRTITLWTETQFAVSLEPVHQPVAPPGYPTAALAALGDRDDY